MGSGILADRDEPITVAADIIDGDEVILEPGDNVHQELGCLCPDGDGDEVDDLPSWVYEDGEGNLWANGQLVHREDLP